MDRNASGTRTLDRDLGPGPWTGTFTAPSERGDLCSLAVTGGVLLSGSTRLWPQPDKRAEHRGDTRDDGGTGGGETWGWGIGERRSPFVRHAPPAFLCWRHSFPKFPRANPAARLGVSTADTYGMVTVCLALPPPLPRPSSRKSRSEEKRALSRVFR